MTAGEPGLTPDLEALAAWARAWVNPVPALIERLGADRLPDAIRQRATELETALQAALAPLPHRHPSTRRATGRGARAGLSRDGGFAGGASPEADSASLPNQDRPSADHARRALTDALVDAADAARTRFTASSDPADADVAITFDTAAIASTLPDTLDRALLQISLARTYLQRRLIDRDDEASVDHAYDVITESLATLDRLGGVLHPQTQASAATRGASTASYGGAALRVTMPALVEANGVLAEILSERFSWRGDDADLDRAIAHATRSRALADGTDSADATGPAHRASADDRLALLLRLRHDHRGDNNDLNLAIVHAEAAVAATPPGDPHYAMRLGNLGLRLATRFNVAGDRTDLDRSIDLARAGLATDGLSPHDRRRLLGNLAIRLKTRHSQASDPDDLDAAITMEAQAMTLAPTGTPQPLWLLNNYSVSLSARYTRRGDPADLDQAITLAEAALALSPPGNADRPSRLSNLSIVLSTRYEHRGDPADLNRAIDLSGQAIAETPSNSPFLNIRQHNHGTHLAIRYDRQGAPADLDDAIDLARASIEGTPEDSPDQPSRRGNLALRYAARYAGRGRLEDLEAAIREGERALEITPLGALERPIRLANLASALAHRWQREHRAGLHGSFHPQTRPERPLLNPSPDGSQAPTHPGTPTAPTTGSASYREHGETDLDRAIACTQEALARTEAGSPERASNLAALARFQQWRFEVAGATEDRRAAQDHAQTAVDATPDGHPGKAARLSLLASLSASSDDPQTSGRALDLHRSAWATVTSTPGVTGFAVVDIGNALATVLHARLDAASDDRIAGDPLEELWRVLTGTLGALDGYLARLPLDADEAALFTVGTYGHLYAWLIEAAVRRVEAANARGEDSLALVREAFVAIERSKGRRLVSRFQAGALRPTASAQPFVDALEQLKPEIDRLETLLFGGSEPPRRLGEADEYPSGASLGWLGEQAHEHGEADSGAERAKSAAVPVPRHPGAIQAWVSDTDAARQVSDRARMAVRLAELQAEFVDLLHHIERSDPTYATARGYAAPRSPEAVAQSLPPGAVLVVFAPVASRTAVVVLSRAEAGKLEASLALEAVSISEAQWVRLVGRTFRRGVDATSGEDAWSLTALDRELEGALRAVGDRLIPAMATLLPDPEPTAAAPTGRHLIIVPTGAMHRLPLHAVPWAPAGIARWDGSTRLADRYIVSYASMADVLPLVTPRPVADRGVASIAPGLGLHADDAAPHATVALAAALAREAWRQTPLSRDEGMVALRLGVEASRDELLARGVLAGRRFGFVATHGRAGGTVGSGLLVHRGHGDGPSEKPGPAPILSAVNAPSSTLGPSRRDSGDGTWVSSAEILARLNLGGVDHLQMLACSTHADDPAPGDHLSSLLTALLICGARSVGGTLWAVDEVAAVLMGYRLGIALLRGEANKAQALRDATQWLRQATGAEIAVVLADLSAALTEHVPDGDRARGALADMADRFRAHADYATAPPFADVVHWAPYVLHGAPLVGSHG